MNFTVTEQGLEDQLLTLVVRKERADLAEQRATLIEQDNEFKIKMVELEDQILFKLATAEGDISEDVELIEGEKGQPINTYNNPTYPIIYPIYTYKTTYKQPIY